MKLRKLFVPTLAAALAAGDARAQGIKNDYTSCHGSTVVTYTAGSCGTTGSTAGSGSTYTLDYTTPSIAAGSNKFILVGIALTDTAATISSVVLDPAGSAVTLDKLIGATNHASAPTCKVYIYGKKHTLTGAKVVRVTTTASKRLMITAQSFSNVLDRDYSVADGMTNNWAKYAIGTTGPVSMTKNSEVGDYLFSTVCATRSSATDWFLGTTPPYKPQIPLIDSCIDAANNCQTAEATTTIRYACGNGVGSNGGAYGGTDVLCANPGTSSLIQHDLQGSSMKWVASVIKLEPTYPSAIRLDDFTVGRAGAGNLLRWRTGLEVDNLGFDVYREEAGGRRVRLSREPVPGAALMTGAGRTLAAGQSYDFEDAAPPAGARYYLEEIDLSGARKLHGPARVTAAGPSFGARVAAAAVAQVEAAAVSGPPAPPEAPVPVIEVGGSHAGQWAHAAGAALKLGIDRAGWYEVGAVALRAAGLAAGVDPRRLALFVEGEEIPLLVRGEADGRLDDGDAVAFYARGLNAASTDTRVYWLVERDGARRVPGGTLTAGQGVDRFVAHIERRPRTVYFTALRNGEASNFFGPSIRQTAVVETLVAARPVAGAAPVLEVGVQGVSAGPHTVSVSANGSALGTIGLAQQERVSRSFSLPFAVPEDGRVEVSLASLGEGDVSMLDFVRLAYPRAAIADGGTLAFLGEGAVSLAGFAAGAPVDVIDVSDERAPVLLGTATADAGGGFGFVVPGAGPRQLVAQARGQGRLPRFVVANQPSALNAAQAGADLVVIGRRDLFPALAPWRSAREAQGLSVALVDVEDVFDEWSFGARQPAALRSFLARARSSWATPPRAVLLLGDASLDPRDHLGKGANDVVPTKLIDTAIFETASDDWFTDLDDDGIADVPVGRLPVRTPDELSAVVGKILAAPTWDAPGAGAGPLVLVTDKNDEVNDFQAAGGALRAALPAGIGEIVVDRNQVENASSSLAAALGQSPSLVGYVGHGSQDLWPGGLLSTASVAEVAGRGAPAFWAGMTCLNGFFQDAHRASLAEALLTQPSGGAFGVWASSGFTNLRAQGALGRVFAEGLTRRALTVGEAARAAKAAVEDIDVRRTWILFGDPTWRMFRTAVTEPPDAGPADGPGESDAGVMAPDAGGPTDAEPVDAGGPGPADAPVSGVDVGSPPAGSGGEGCACDVGGAPRGGAAWLVGLAFVALVRRRRR